MSEGARPGLSVIVVNWNTREMLLACVEAASHALAEWSREDGRATELIVVDNGSCDGSGAAVAERFPSVETVLLESNRGFAGGANAGLARARGAAVLLLNTDATLQPGAIAACLDVFERDPRVGIVGPQLLHADGRLQNSVHAFPSLAGELLPTWLLETLLPRRFPSKRSPQAGPVEVEAVIGAAIFASRPMLEEIGDLPEDYFFFLEETDWCLRARRAGWGVVHVPEARVLHLSGASSKRRDPARTRIEFHRSLYRFFELNRGAGMARVVRVIRVVKGAGSVLLLSLAAPFSARHRARMRERLRVLEWHARGRPDDWGLTAATAPSGER